MCLIIIIKLENYSIIMNDISSLLMATSILAIGGLGLYMYKNADDNDDDDISYNEDTFFANDNEDDNEEEDEVQPDYLEHDYEELEEEIYQPKSKTKGKTKRNRKTTGTKRRR